MILELGVISNHHKGQFKIEVINRFCIVLPALITEHANRADLIRKSNATPIEINPYIQIYYFADNR